MPESIMLDTKSITFYGLDEPIKVGQVLAWGYKNMAKFHHKMYAAIKSSSGQKGFINVMNIRQNQSHFLCSDSKVRNRLEHVFGTKFDDDMPVVKPAYLRKEIIK